MPVSPVSLLFLFAVSAATAAAVGGLPLVDTVVSGGDPQHTPPARPPSVASRTPLSLEYSFEQDIEPYIRRTATFTRAFERNHLSSAAGPGQQDKSAGRSAGAGGVNGQFSRRGSATDMAVPAGVEEAPR